PGNWTRAAALERSTGAVLQLRVPPVVGGRDEDPDRGRFVFYPSVAVPNSAAARCPCRVARIGASRPPAPYLAPATESSSVAQRSLIAPRRRRRQGCSKYGYARWHLPARFVDPPKLRIPR